jgi:hypothetical protein
MPATLTAATRPPAREAGALSWVSAHRWPLLAALLLVGVVVALGVATYRPDLLPGRARPVADRVINGIGRQASEAAKTVASLFEARSPGERLAGALASLKQKRQPLLHERALPKVRRPLSPLAAIVAAPPPPIATVPVFEAVGGPKPGGPGVPVALTTPPGGGPVVFPFTPLPGGGGGVILPPPTTITPPPGPPIVPTTPTPSGVPEPGSWAMMLLGFVLIGGALRRKIFVKAAHA